MKYFRHSFRVIAAFVLLGFLFTSLAVPVAHTQETAPAQGVEGGTIRSIDIQYVGPPSVSRERILANMRTRVGTAYSETTVEEDIRNLYGTGNLSNVRIYGTRQGNGVKVQVIIATSATVNEIVIDGAERIKPQKVRDQIKFKVPGPMNAETLEEGRQKIVELYQRTGFTGVEVTLRIENEEARGRARAIYTINEGAKGAVRGVSFEGNHAFSDRVLRKQMKTKAKTLISFFDKSGRLDSAQLQQDLDSVREFYQDHGYIDVAIPDVRQIRSEGKLRLVVIVSEGPLYHVGKISFTGQKITTEQKLRAIIKMKEGSVYSPKNLRDDTKAISDGYGAGGFVDLQILPQGTPAAPGVVDVAYKIDEGERSFVERINIVGNTRTKDKVIRREITVIPGDIFNTVRVETSRKRLENLGYFSKVETYPEDTSVPSRKDLLVQLEEKRTGSLNFGAGFSTIDSLVGFVELTQGNFDLFNWPNFTGGGEKFRSRIQYGAKRKDFSVSLTQPYLFDKVLSLGGEAFYREANFLSSLYDQRNYGFDVELRKPVSSFASVSLNYRLEEIDIFNVSSEASSQIRQEAGNRLKSEVSTTVLFDTRDNVFLTRHGQRIVFTPHIAGGPLGGNTQTYGFDLEGSQYVSLPYDTILLFNGEVAAVDTWGNGDRVPIFDRLFLGGSNNLRGFGFRKVGPQDKKGEPVGGLSLARFTAEYTFPIIEKVRGAVFYDTGFVSPKAFDFGGTNIASDIGIGVRLDLPIGPLRIDYGYPIQRAGEKGGGKINFNIGYQF